MDSNTHSVQGPGGLGRLAAAVEELAAEDLTRLPAGEAAGRVLVLRELVERLEGQWLRELAAVDGRGAAGAEDGTQADSTAGWLRRRLRAGHTQASGWVRTARALFRGPLGGTGRALAAGELSVAHAAVLACGTADLPAGTAADAEPVLLAAARRLDPPRLRRVVAHLREVADPDGAQARAQRQHERRGLWVSPHRQPAIPRTARRGVRRLGSGVDDGDLRPALGDALLPQPAPVVVHAHPPGVAPADQREQVLRTSAASRASRPVTRTASGSRGSGRR